MMEPDQKFVEALAELIKAVPDPLSGIDWDKVRAEFEPRIPEILALNRFLGLS